MAQQVSEDEIFSYVAGDLSGAPRSQLGEQAARNPALADRLDKLRRDRDALVAEFPARRASAATPVPARSRRVAGGPLGWMAAAATVALVALGGYGIGTWQTQSDAPSTMQVLNAIDDARNQALETAANSDAVSTTLPGGAVAVVRPLTTYMDEQGRFCRAFETVITAGEQVSAVRGHACRSDGAWAVQAERPADIAANEG